MLILARHSRKSYSSHMSGEFLTHYSVEQSENAQEHIESSIEQAGSLENYLLSVEVDQARTPNGRAELLRLQRVSRFIASPYTTEETAESMAFYKGALFGATVAAALQDGEFNAGTLAHTLLNEKLTEERIVKENYITGPSGQTNKTAIAEELEFQTYTWPEGKGDAIETLYQLAEHHLPTLYPNDDDLYDDAIVGFWAPLRMVYEKQLNVDTMPDEDISDAELIPFITERSLLNAAFYSAYREFKTTLETIKDEEVTSSIYKVIEGKLQQLNDEHSLITPDQLFCVSGEGLYRSSFNGMYAENQPLTPEIEIIGHFGGLTVLDTPVLKEGANKNSDGWRVDDEEYNEQHTTQMAGVGIIIKEPTFLNYTTEEEVISAQGVEVTIPIIYTGIDIGTLEQQPGPSEP